MGEAFDALDGNGEASLSALGFDNSAEGAFANLLDDFIVLSNFHPGFRKAERFEFIFLSHSNCSGGFIVNIGVLGLVLDDKVVLLMMRSFCLPLLSGNRIYKRLVHIVHVHCGGV